MKLRGEGAREGKKNREESRMGKGNWERIRKT